MAKPQQRETGDIKVLSVVWYKVLPPRYGGQKAVAMFNQYLADLTPLVCLCSTNNLPGDQRYQVMNWLPVSKWQFLNPFIWRKIYKMARQQKITHLILEFPYHGIAGFICKKSLDICLITNTHNIEYQRFREQKKWWWRLLFYFEKWTLNRSDIVFFKTTADLQEAVHHFGLIKTACEVIPYGTERRQDIGEAKAKKMIKSRHQIANDELIFLFAGTLDYQPNADAVMSIHEKLVPLLNKFGMAYRVIICGRNLLPEFSYINEIRNARMIFAGEAEDIESYFQSADVFINPVLTGGGIQTKIIDALSFNLSVVCFQSKFHNIKHTAGKVCSIPDGDWQAFAAASIEMARQKVYTPADFFETYHWPTIVGRAYTKMLAC